MKILFIGVILFLTLVGCGSNDTNSSTDSTTTKQTKSTYSKAIQPQQTIVLEYPDKSAVSYKWWSEDGGLLGTSDSIEWTAPKKPGEYTISVDAYYANKSKKSLSITLRVVSDSNSSDVNNTPSNSAPTITLKGAKEMTITLDQAFNDPGAEATDKEDGNLTNAIQVSSDVDTHKEGRYHITYRVEDSEKATAQVTRTVIVKAPTLHTPARSFADIKAMIQASKDGLMNDLTYIIVGDSTRADTHTAPADKDNNSQLYFETLQAKLNDYNVNTILMARGSHEIKQFLDGSNNPTVDQVIDLIPNDGEEAIIDFSLGVNDFFELNDERIQNNAGSFAENRANWKKIIKDRLIEAIQRIWNAKPKTSIVLVTPNAIKNWKDGTDLMTEIYKEVAKEQNLPLADFVDDKMDGGATENNPAYDDWYRDGIHFSDKALKILSNYMLNNILP